MDKILKLPRTSAKIKHSKFSELDGCSSTCGLPSIDKNKQNSVSSSNNNHDTNATDTNNDLWKRLYDRDLSTSDYLEIENNLLAFFKVLEEEAKKNG
ncbi:MAG: hypothetical protein HQK49_19580 [Oligoflexia bacterium]|nr:hypothetical protein [Oligoflexia bacterium]